MTISPEIARAGTELEAWARVEGWNAVTIAITEQYHSFCPGGDLLESMSLDAAKAIHNNKQRLQRAFRGDSYHYRTRAAALLEIVICAMPADRRARLTAPDSISYRATLALRGCTQAVTAVLLGSPHVDREVDVAIDSLMAMREALAPRQ